MKPYYNTPHRQNKSHQKSNVKSTVLVAGTVDLDLDTETGMWLLKTKSIWDSMMYSALLGLDDALRFVT